MMEGKTKENSEMDIVHKKQTDEESYQGIKRLYKKYPKLIMNPKDWKKQQLIILKKEGRVWSK